MKAGSHVVFPKPQPKQTQNEKSRQISICPLQSNGSVLSTKYVIKKNAKNWYAIIIISISQFTYSITDDELPYLLFKQFAFLTVVGVAPTESRRPNRTQVVSY